MRVFEGWPSWEAAYVVLAEHLPPNVLDRLAAVYRFAAERHKGQTRPAGEPYIRHLLEVVEVLVEGIDEQDPELLTAALLHDVIEDTSTTRDEVAERFGPRVAELVGWVTQSTPGHRRDRATVRVEYLRRLADASAPAAAVTLKLADRLTNVQRLHTHPRPERQRVYYAETREHILPLAAGHPWFASWFSEWERQYRYLES